MKKLILGILCILIISEISMAKEKYIKLEDNTYQMENICFITYKISDKNKSFGRYYKFVFNSKNNVFENYDNAYAYNDSIVIKTNLYTFNITFPYIFKLSDNGPEIITNKKTIEVVLSEDDMKKLYESNSAKVIFDRSIFTKDYIGAGYVKNYEESKRTGLIVSSYVEPQPVISITLNKKDFNYELKKCNEKFNTYSKEYDEYHSKPINRVKTFFNF